MQLTQKQRQLLEKLPGLLREDFLRQLRQKNGIGAGNEAALTAAIAAYYRAKPEWGITIFDLAAPYDAETARKASRGTVRVINIEWSFPDGRLNYLFNPTLEKGPVNHEWLWQLGRHYFWRDMARAYAATGDEGYAAAFETQLLDWVEQTALPRDWNAPGSAWRTIECGLRLMDAWQIAFSAFRHSPSVSDEALLLMLVSMSDQARHLAEHHTAGNNWVMMEMAGVYTFAALFPELAAAGQLRQLSGSLLSGEFTSQLLPDGMQYELSPDYHFCVFNCAASVYLIAKRTGFAGQLPGEYADGLRRATQACIDLATPAFTQPRTNDCYTLRTADLVKLADAIFPGDPVCRYVLTDRAGGTPPAGQTSSRFLPYAGFCAMRSGWDRDAAYLLFDVGPLGKNHQHQDMLNIHLYKAGQELIFDDGGGQYEVSPMREYALSAADHNTVLVDGLGQNRCGPLATDKPIDAAWYTGPEYDYARAAYDGAFGPFSFESMGKGQLYPAIHTRQVLFCKPDIFFVRDDLTARDGKPHSYELRFHTDTLTVQDIPQLPGALRGCFAGEYDILLIPLDGEGEQTSILSGQTQPRYAGWFNGRNESDCHRASTLTRRVENAENHTFLTLLIPIRKGEPLPVLVWQQGTAHISFRGREYTVDTDKGNTA